MASFYFIDEQELKKEILQLQGYRRNRLTCRHQVRMYHNMKKMRDKDFGDRHLLNDVLSHIKVISREYSVATKIVILF